MDYIVKFSRPYTFEGQEYTQIDLSGLENLKASDLQAADKEFAASGQIAPVNEMSIGYACILGARATAQPADFFNNLPAKDAISVKSVVTNFLLG